MRSNAQWVSSVLLLELLRKSSDDRAPIQIKHMRESRLLKRAGAFSAGSTRLTDCDARGYDLASRNVSLSRCLNMGQVRRHSSLCRMRCCQPSERASGVSGPPAAAGTASDERQCSRNVERRWVWVRLDGVRRLMRDAALAEATEAALEADEALRDSTAA